MATGHGQLLPERQLGIAANRQLIQRQREQNTCGTNDRGRFSGKQPLRRHITEQHDPGDQALIDGLSQAQVLSAACRVRPGPTCRR